MLEPYAVKVARTVLRGGKPERAYLSQLDTLVVHTLNDGGYWLGPFLLPCEPLLFPGELWPPGKRFAQRRSSGLPMINGTGKAG